MPKKYTHKEVIEMLVKRQGNRTQAELAAEMGISQQYLSDLLKARRTPGPPVLRFLELEVAYVKVETAA